MGIKLDDLLKENSAPLLEDKSKKTINMLLVTIAAIIMILIIVIAMAVMNASAKAQRERAEKLATDIDLISTYIKNVYADYRVTGDDSEIIGEFQEAAHVTPIVLEVNGNKEEYRYGYYYVTGDEINQMIPTLSIKGEDYVVNYSNGNAVNLIGAKYNGKTYYDVDDLRAISKNEVPPSDYAVYINSPEDMLQLHKIPNGYFKLQKDIDMSAYSTGDGWQPVAEFSGKIDGRGYIIKNLTVSRASDRFCGLFGKVKDGAKINNLKLENVNISGGEYTGAIAGTCSGTVMNCTVTGNVSSQSSNVGGVFGLFENGVAQKIISRVSVNGSESVGGFVGSMTSGTIESCSAEGNVTGINKIGGFAGRVTPLSLTTISQVGTTATIIANENAGGFIGGIEAQNASQLNIVDSYSKGKITACTRTSGGFIGNLSAVSTASLNFTSLYTVVDTPNLCDVRGGFVGNVTAAGASSQTSNCFWEKDNLNDGALDGAGKTNNQAITFESHSPAEMRVIATFGKWNMEIWKFSDGNTPTLKWQ